MWCGMSNMIYVVVPWKWHLFSGRSYFCLWASFSLCLPLAVWLISLSCESKVDWSVVKHPDSFLIHSVILWSVLWLILSPYSPDLLRKAVLLDCALLDLQDWCSLSILRLLPCIFYINVLIKTSDHDGWVFMSVILLWTMKSGRKSQGTWETCANELVLCELLTCSSRQSLELIHDRRWDSL